MNLSQCIPHLQMQSLKTLSVMRTINRLKGGYPLGSYYSHRVFYIVLCFNMPLAVCVYKGVRQTLNIIRRQYRHTQVAYVETPSFL